MLRRGRVRSCVRPTLRGLRTAGPDAIRSLAPKQIYALEWRITLDGFFQAPGLTRLGQLGRILRLRVAEKLVVGVLGSKVRC